MHLANKINKWVHSGPYANYAEIDPVTAGLIATAAVSAGGSYIKRKQEEKLIKKQKKERLKQLDAMSQMSAEEQQAMARMRKGAEQGTMDVAKLNQQMAQPLYQQGEAQEAQAMQKITQQGLEGSIIAQDVSRKVGSDVRASIAQQARQIAMDNERTKADAARRLSQAQMQRGQLLRDIAMKRQGAISDADIAQMRSKQDFASGLYSAGTDLATGALGNYMNQNYITASKETHPTKPGLWGTNVKRSSVLDFPTEENEVN
tara:strand:- start:8732 stop:9511 length:780 start_codon:yes stop_codon:yes gene_type:complete